jgi:hypothetical protein
MSPLHSVLNPFQDNDFNDYYECKIMNVRMLNDEYKISRRNPFKFAGSEKQAGHQKQEF